MEALNPKPGKASEQQALSLVKIFAQFDEYSDYENIFTGNMRALYETQNLNRKIQDFVAFIFKDVDFKKDSQH